MRQEKPKVNLRKDEEFATHSCGSVHFALTRQGNTVRGYCVQCNGLVLETFTTQFRYSDNEAHRKIHEAYGDQSMEIIFAEASSHRVGSEHEEEPRGGEAWCKTCGLVERGTANPEFHPEAYA